MRCNISIAMATFNGERYLGQQLESLAAQTQLPAELVVCDDGSTDATLAVLRQFSCSAPFPVKIIENPHRLGYAENFLKAAKLCKFEWIAFCDQDDYWRSNKLQAVSREINTHPEAILVAHPALLVDESLTSLGKTAWPSKYRVYRKFGLSPWRSGMGCGQVFRSFLVTDVPTDNRFLVSVANGRKSPHDDWILKLSQCFGPAVYLSEALVWRRRHPASVTASKAPPVRSRRKVLHKKDIRYMLISEISLARQRASVLSDCADRAGASWAKKDLYAASRYYLNVAAVLKSRLEWRECVAPVRQIKAIRSLITPRYWQLGSGVGGWRSACRDAVDLAVRPLRIGADP